MGKNLVRVCHGTACHVSGAKDLTDEIQSQLKVTNGETTEDGLFTLETGRVSRMLPAWPPSSW